MFGSTQKSITFAPLSTESLCVINAAIVDKLRAEGSHAHLCRGAKDNRAEFCKNYAAIAQLVEHDLAKVGVASSSLVCRSVL